MENRLREKSRVFLHVLHFQDYAKTSVINLFPFPFTTIYGAVLAHLNVIEIIRENKQVILHILD